MQLGHALDDRLSGCAGRVNVVNDQQQLVFQLGSEGPVEIAHSGCLTQRPLYAAAPKATRCSRRTWPTDSLCHRGAICLLEVALVVGVLTV